VPGAACGNGQPVVGSMSKAPPHPPTPAPTPLPLQAHQGHRARLSACSCQWAAPHPHSHPQPLHPCRRIKATEPGERLFLSVGCTHPDYGDFFLATFDARISSRPHLPNETASLGTLLRWVGVVWCGVVWCGVVWCGVVWHLSSACHLVWLGT